MVRALAPAYLAVNYEAQATQDARTRAMDSVSPVVVQVNQGERILDFGQKVSQYDMEVLSAEGLVHSALDVQNLIGALILALILLALTAGYVMRYRTDLLRRRELLGLVALVDVAVLLVAKILVPAHPYGQYMVPMAAAPILVATLLDARLGLLNALGLGLLTGILAGNIAELTVLGFAGPALGILAMRRTESMAQLLRAGFLVALASFFALYGIGLLERRLPQQQLSEVSLIAGTASFVGTVLAIGMFNWLGELFGIATPTRLLELSNPSNPLLKRLMIQAPGTYNHSLMVGNLVEAAAPLVGADPLIARLGAYFHDIGKTRRPQFFVENQATTGNIHQTLPPATSAAILDSHVIEGVELVEQYHFPQIIRDIVAQHQGTGVKTYFYRQALEKDPATPIDAYRYPGPKPQTKEAALVMLADGVEASCRTLADPSSDAIRNQVERIARTVVQDGQLDECDLTFRDIDRITETFQNLMVNIHHQRVVYPEGPGAGSRFGGGMASAGPALPTPATPVISAPGAGRRRDKRVAAQDR
jgi:putative nucleotidyltransferase with HDIG domain